MLRALKKKLSAPHSPFVREIARSGISSAAMKILSGFSTIAVSVVLARILGPDDYGIYALALAVASIVAIPVNSGLPTLVVRETATRQAQERWGGLRGLWIWSDCLAVLYGIVVLTIGTAILSIDYAHTADHQRTTLIWGLALVPLLGLGALRGAALRGLRHIGTAYLAIDVLRHGILLMLLAGLIVWHHAVGPEVRSSTAMMSHVLAAATATLIASVLLFRRRPTPLNQKPRTHFETHTWLATLLPLAMLGGMQVINKNADIVMLSMFTTSADVGVYKVAAQAQALVAFMLGAANMVVAPYFARLYTRKDVARLQSLLTISARAVFAGSLPVVALFIFAGDTLLALTFGAEYTDAHLPLIILACAHLANTAFGSVGLLLNMTGYERETLSGVATAACMNILLNAMLVPRYGTIGAAIATALALALWNLLLWRSAKKQLGLDSSIFGLRT